MDSNALFALATAALHQCPGADRIRNEVDARNGSEHTNGLASGLVGFSAGLDKAKHCFNPIFGFNFGFDLGLEIGAAIAKNPGKLPDLKAILKATKAEIDTFINVDVARGMGCLLCIREGKEAA
jgi:hypothetical protein